jgi:hypothetical protein
MGNGRNEISNPPGGIVSSATCNDDGYFGGLVSIPATLVWELSTDVLIATIRQTLMQPRLAAK